MKDLTMAQAITIVALLAFAIAWFAMLDWTADDDKAEELSSGAAVMMAALWFGPPIWALWLTTAIVRGDD